MQTNTTNFSTTATLAGASATAATMRKSRNDKLYSSYNSIAGGAKEMIEEAFKTAKKMQ